MSNDFKISDKRRFHTDGSPKEETMANASETHRLENAETDGLSPDFPSSTPEENISFSHLVLSLAGSAQIQLGIAKSPWTGKIEKNLPEAKRTIDLLGILSEKTKGNLSAEEAQLLEVLLADLRLRFVEGKI